MKLKERKLNIEEKRVVSEVSEQDYYIAEVKVNEPLHFEGIEAYFNYLFEDAVSEERNYSKVELINDVETILDRYKMIDPHDFHKVEVLNDGRGIIKVMIPYKILDKDVKKCCESIHQSLYKKYMGEDYIKPIPSLKNFPVDKNLWETGPYENFKEVQDKVSETVSALQKEKEAKIEKMRTEIEEEYNKRINSESLNLKKYDFEIKAYQRLVQSYSTFSVKENMEVFASLISVFEGQEYVYEYAIYEYFNGVGMESYFYQSFMRKDVCLRLGERYKEHELDNLSKQNKAIILSKRNGDIRSSVTFYQFNDNDELVSTVDYGNFDYLKEFIDGVILYRMSNDLKSISEKELMFLLKQYITSKREIIEEKYTLLEKQEKDEMQKELDSKQENRQKYLTSFLNN